MKRKPTKKAAKQANKSKRYTPDANAPKKTAPPKAAPSRKKRRGPSRVINKKRAFLEAFVICGSITGASIAAHMDRNTHYDWMKADPDYPARFQDAKTRASDAVDDEIAERAMRGVYEPNIFQGKFVYPQEEVITPAVIGPRGGIQEPERREWRDVPGAMPLGVWRKSDTLLIHLSRGLMPEKYGFRGAMEVTGPQGGPIEIVERLNRAHARMAALKVQGINQ